MTLEELQRFRQLGARTAGHPEYGHAPGIETTTGPLGQGLANAVGMALAERHLAARFGAELVDHHTYVIAGDGCLMEGISHEAASLAGHLKLGRLIVLFDDNGISIDGPTSLSVSDDQLGALAAYGWHTAAVDGHDPVAIERPSTRRARDRPAIADRLQDGDRQGRAHQGRQAPSTARRSVPARSRVRASGLGWPYPPFEIPTTIAPTWRPRAAAAPSQRGLAAAPRGRRPRTRPSSTRAIAGELPATFARRSMPTSASCRPRAGLGQPQGEPDGARGADRAVPTMVGGSADLTHSNSPTRRDQAASRPATMRGRYVNYGVREHAMVAAMNGMAVHGGIIPYGGTFLVFADYCRPSLRLAALMQQRVIFVATHDSIGLGEDGPTHQPVEHLASLRAIPNMLVFRPADAVETMECWELALRQTDGPVDAGADPAGAADAARDAYRGESVRPRRLPADARPTSRAQVTILATGSEVHIALAARELLAAEGIVAAVVSMPCWELFERQDAAYRGAVLGTAPRVAVEAASPFGWTRYVASEADVVGMTSFGASGPIKALYEHFGLTAENVARKARALL